MPFVGSQKKSKKAYEEMLAAAYSVKPVMLYGDLTRNEDINRLVEELSALGYDIDLLINNAGSFKPKLEYSLEGIEMTMAINVVAMVRLTELLRGKYADMTIINITSMMFKQGNISVDNLFNSEPYNGSQRYSDSKQMVVYYTQWLSEQMNGHGAAIGMHPGVVATDVFRDYTSPIIKLANIFLQKPESAARRILKPYYMGTVTGGYYYSQQKKKNPLETFVDLSLRDELMTKIKGLL